MEPENEAVTVVVTHSVKPGCEAEFDEWLRGISAAAARHDGYRGSVAIPHARGSQDRHIAFRFDSLRQLDVFQCSTEYQRWRTKLAELTTAPSRYHRELGLEHWFVPPGAPPPSRHKMTVVVFLAIAPLVTFVAPHLGPWLARWLPVWLAGCLTTAVIVLLMSYVALPLMTRLFRRWLR